MKRAMAGLFVIVSSFGLAAPTRAQDDDLRTRREEAKKLADSAFDLMNKGFCDESIRLFRKADERFHSPVFLLYVAACQEKQGKLIAARRELQKIVGEELAPYSPESFRKAQADARQRLAALDERIPQVTLTVEGAPLASVSVTLDGEPMAGAELSSPLRVDPGSHRLRAVGPNGAADEERFEAPEGARLAVALSLGPVATSSTAGAGASGRSYVPAAIAFGLGGVGLVIGAVTGAVFVARAGDLEEACENDGDADATTCPDSDEIDAVRVLGDVSTAGWVIAGVGAAAGVVLLLVPIDGDESATVALEPGGLSIRGRF